jgi:hypothetical protein
MENNVIGFLYIKVAHSSETLDGQYPLAAILNCINSRMPTDFFNKIF